MDGKRRAEYTGAADDHRRPAQALRVPDCDGKWHLGVES